MRMREITPVRSLRLFRSASTAHVLYEPCRSSPISRVVACPNTGALRGCAIGWVIACVAKLTCLSSPVDARRAAHEARHVPLSAQQQREHAERCA